MGVQTCCDLVTDGREEELGTDAGGAGGGETCCGLLTDEREEGQGRAGGEKIYCGLVNHGDRGL